MEIRIGCIAFNMNSLLVSSSIANVSRLGCASSFCMFFCMMISVRFCMRCLIGSHAQVQALDPARNPGQNPDQNQAQDLSRIPFRIQHRIQPTIQYSIYPMIQRRIFPVRSVPIASSAPLRPAPLRSLLIPVRSGLLRSPTLCSAPPPSATLRYANVRYAPLAAKFRSGTDCHAPLRSIPLCFATLRSGPLCISLLRSGTMRCGPFCAQLRYATLQSARRQFRPEVLAANSGRLRPARHEFHSVLVCILPPAVNSALSPLSRDVFRPISRYMLVLAKCLRARALVVIQWLACECVVRTKKGTIFNLLVRGGI